MEGIVINDNRHYAVYARDNKRLAWRYADYGGRWETLEQAIKKANERFGGTHIQYRIEVMGTDEVHIGEIARIDKAEKT